MDEVIDFCLENINNNKNVNSLFMNIFNMTFKMSYNDESFYKEIKNEYAYFAQFNATPSVNGSITINVISADIPAEISKAFETKPLIKMHSSESKQLKYYTDGRILNNEGALRTAKKAEFPACLLFYCLKTGNIIFFDKTKRNIYVIGPNKQWVETKDIIETICISNLECNGHLMVHASCTEDKLAQGYLIIGNTGKGKTSLMLHFINNSGHKFVSNDRIYIDAASAASLKISGAPIQLNIGLGSFKTMPDLEKYIPHSLQTIYQNEKDIEIINKYKIRFDCYQFKELFHEQVETCTELKYICIPKLDLENKSYVRSLDFETGIDILKNNLLSPLDEHHPKWLGFYEISENIIFDNINSLFEKIKNYGISIIELGMGYDTNDFFNLNKWQTINTAYNR